MEGVKHVVLVNCGATIDLCDFLDPAEEVIFYVLDNHRPVDVTNIYNDGQVRLCMKKDLFEAFRDNMEGVKHVVLVNCGATIDLCDFLDPAEEVIFYVLDNHRPVD